MTETMEQPHAADPETAYCRNLLSAVIHRSLDDIANERRRASALAFFASEHFESLAEMLGLNVVAVRRQVIPDDYQCREVVFAAKPKLGRPRIHALPVPKPIAKAVVEPDLELNIEHTFAEL